jgi:formate hydrogenlyase subunit 3/multisubunit Na+/H+ antiporter MnhD subunit
MYILFFGAFVVYTLKSDVKRKQVVYGLLFFNLVFNSFLCVMHIFYNFNGSNLKGTYITIELILIFGLIATQFSNNQLENSSNKDLYDFLVLIIIFGLIGIVLTTNIMSIILWFLFLSLIFGVIFFIDNFKKELVLLKFYFIVLIISAICLIGATILIYLATGSLELDVINGIQISEELNNFISITLYLGIGLLCGLIPFSIFHLNISFIAIRILNTLSHESLIVSFTLIILLILGIILSMVYITIELFTHIDGNTHSIKKIFGYSVVLDFNMVLLFFVFSNLLTTPLIEIFLNSIIYFLLTI